MSVGLAALLDDIAALVKLAAASVDDVAAAAGRASVKAAGVVVDDTAVAPQYVRGLSPARELPIVLRITRGSLINKLVFILPLAILLSEFAEWALTPLLMLGGAYLSFEGAEKLWERISGHQEHAEEKVVEGKDAEKRVVSGAVRTDFILSAEIMVIALNEVAHEGLWQRILILAIVAILITLLVYGVVALIVKMDDVGLHLARTARTAPMRRFGGGLVKAMPTVLAVLSTVGMIAMLWVGGHIILSGTHELGLAVPYEWVHHVAELVTPLAGVGPVLAWLVDTISSAIIGIIVGAVLVSIVHLIGRLRGPKNPKTASTETA